MHLIINGSRYRPENMGICHCKAEAEAEAEVKIKAKGGGQNEKRATIFRTLRLKYI